MMSLDEYIKLLNQIEAPEFEHLAKKLKFYLKQQKFYNVNLNSREIEAPPFLGVKGDHEAQVICFVVDRWFENMDLGQDVTWVVQYINAKGEPFLYRIPFYDTYLFKEEGKLVLPWIIRESVTDYAGKVQFSLECYRLDKNKNPSYNSIALTEKTYAAGIYYYDNENGERVIDNSENFTPDREYYEYTHKIEGFLFNLNTKPVYSQVLYSLDIKNLPDVEYEYLLVEGINEKNFAPGIFYIKNIENQYVLADSYIAGKDYYLKNKSTKTEQIHEIYAELTTLKNQLDEWDICWEEV